VVEKIGRVGGGTEGERTKGTLNHGLGAISVQGKRRGEGEGSEGTQGWGGRGSPGKPLPRLKSTSCLEGKVSRGRIRSKRKKKGGSGGKKGGVVGYTLKKKDVQGRRLKIHCLLDLSSSIPRGNNRRKTRGQKFRRKGISQEKRRRLGRMVLGTGGGKRVIEFNNCGKGRAGERGRPVEGRNVSTKSIDDQPLASAGSI